MNTAKDLEKYRPDYLNPNLPAPYPDQRLPVCPVCNGDVGPCEQCNGLGVVYPPKTGPIDRALNGATELWPRAMGWGS